MPALHPKTQSCKSISIALDGIRARAMESQAALDLAAEEGIEQIFVKNYPALQRARDALALLSRSIEDGLAMAREPAKPANKQTRKKT